MTTATRTLGRKYAQPSPAHVTGGTAETFLAGNASARAIGNIAIALAVFLGGFVIFEPAPYELFLAGLLVIWFFCGMRLPREIMPLAFLFTLFNFGGIISSFLVADYMAGVIYVAVSYFLALTSIFFAIVIREDMGRLRLIYRVYVAAALVTASLGIIGYFGVPGFDMFTLYSRARGAFEDPNVFAPFLMIPTLYLIYGVMNRSAALMPLRLAALTVLMLAIFLAFSRAAWGMLLISGFIFYMLLFINARQAKLRLKYVILGIAGVSGAVMLLLAALQIDAVADLFKERAQVVQEYDGGRLGRFARHLVGYELALSKPFGIGPLQFGKIYGEDTHNNFVKALMDYGWIGFVSWVAVMLWTIVGGFKLCFRPRPWLPYVQIAYAVFIGHFIVGNVIDTDHWRHFYLMIGIIWGCMALEIRWQETRYRGGVRGTASAPPVASAVSAPPAASDTNYGLAKRSSVLEHVKT